MVTPLKMLHQREQMAVRLNDVVGLASTVCKPILTEFILAEYSGGHHKTGDPEDSGLVCSET